MRDFKIVLTASMMFAAVAAFGQEAQSQSTTTTTTTSNVWWEWEKMTGDWGGARTDLADAGVTIDIGLTQILQANIHGGAETDSGLRYSGSTDYTIRLNTEKMGLWAGGEFFINAETKWGDGVLDKVGALYPVSLDAVKPTVGDGCITTLSEWFYTHALMEGKLILIAGKLDGSRAFDRNAFANDERTQFMNAAFRNNMIIPAFLPYTTLGVGVIVKPCEWATISTAIADTDGRADTIGFDTAFGEGDSTTLIHEWAFHTDLFDMPGNYRVGFVWSNKDHYELQPRTPFRETGPYIISLVGPKRAGQLINALGVTDDSPDNIGIYCNMDQFLITEADDPSQGIGIFGRFGWARGDVNPVEQFYAFGLGGKGIVPGRDNDTCGLGYYHAGLSREMPNQFHSEQGFELYYNIEITPWMHLTPDVQCVIYPGGTGENDVAFVGGMRLQLNL